MEENNSSQSPSNTITDQQLFNFLSQDLEQANRTIAELLSASDQICFELDDLLSSIPIHPFDQLKQEYLVDVPPLCLSSIEISSNFSLSAANQMLEQATEKLNEQFQMQVQALTSTTAENIHNAFAIMSGDTFVIDKQKTASHLQYVDMCNNIPIKLIEQDPMLVAQKLVSQYVKIFS